MRLLIKQFATALLISFLLVYFAPNVLAQENIQFFGTEPLAQEQSRDRNALACLKGFRQFAAAGLGYEGFLDYWRDIILISWRFPMYYADIGGVEDQLNKARYAVMAAFLRCDLNRLKSVTDAYYRLEAELYFLRHFVRIESGFLNTVIANSGSREAFKKEMTEYFVLRKASENPDQDRALFIGYFDLFEGKYRERASAYANFGDDPIYNDIATKFDDLIKSFKDFGNEAAELGKDVGKTVVEGANVAASGAVNFYSHPLKSLGDIAVNIYNRFQTCPVTESPDECKTLDEAIVAGYKKGAPAVITAAQVIGAVAVGVPATVVAGGLGIFDKVVEALASSGEKVTPQEVKKFVSDLERKIDESAVKADMLSRYELLYGRVNGDGITAVNGEMDKLLKILGENSLPPLNKIEECAARVQNSVCSNVF